MLYHEEAVSSKAMSRVFTFDNSVLGDGNILQNFAC